MNKDKDEQELDSIFEYIKELGFKEHVLDRDKDFFLPTRYFIYHTSKERNSDTQTLILYHNNWIFSVLEAKQGHETGIEGHAPRISFTGTISTLEEAKMLFRMIGLYPDAPNVFNPETGDRLIENMLKYN